MYDPDLFCVLDEKGWIVRSFLKRSDAIRELIKLGRPKGYTIEVL